jgi:hypothetical protein
MAASVRGCGNPHGHRWKRYLCKHENSMNGTFTGHIWSKPNVPKHSAERETRKLRILFIVQDWPGTITYYKYDCR